MMLEIESKLADIPPLQKIRFVYDTSIKEKRIRCLGEIVQHQVPFLPEIPDYDTFQEPTVVVWKEGDQNGEFASSRGVAISEETGNIYIAKKRQQENTNICGKWRQPKSIRE